MSFIWNRLLSMPEDLGYVGSYEKPDTELMRMLVESYSDEACVVESAEQLMSKRAYVLNGNGQQYQEYKQKDMSKWAPDGYRGSTIIGRAYTNSLFQRLPSKMLNTIYKTTHLGLDMRSAFTSMLCSAFPDLDLRFMREYCQDPESVYSTLRGRGFDRAAVKRLINGTICAWPSPFESGDVGEMAELGRLEIVQNLRRDVGKMATEVRNRYPGFFEMVRRRCDAEGKTASVEGTALFYLASDMEHSAMRAVIDHLFGSNQLSDVVWKFDGIIFPMSKISGRRYEDVVTEVQRVVKTKLGIDVGFTLDSLEPSFGICIAPEDRNREDGEEGYARWKVCHERKFAMVENPPVYMMFQRGGRTWTDLNQAGYQHVTATQPKDFVKRWHEDPNKRMYHYRDFLPPPRVCPDNVLNVWRGIEAAGLPEVTGVDISLYLKHVDILVGNLHGEHPDYADYIHNLIASKIQQPGCKWGVMPIFISAQGVGKDIWFDFVSSVIGDHYCVKGDGVSDFVEKKSGKLEGKILCCFQEMGRSTSDKELTERTKALITNKTLTIERKYVQEIVVSNVVDFIGFTNRLDAVALSADDRRFAIFTSDSTFMQKREYFAPLLGAFECDRFKRAVYDFYMDRDITAFSPSEHRPKTEAHRSMVEEQAGPLEVFLRKGLKTWKDGWRIQDAECDEYQMHGGILSVNAGIVQDHWSEHAAANNFRNHQNKNAMSQFFSRLAREMCTKTDSFKSEGVTKLVSRRKVSGKRVWDFDVRGIERYLASIFDAPGEDMEPQRKMARMERKARRDPTKTDSFQILEGGEVVFESRDLEQINKELGEAYICPLRGVLVHQHRGNMEIDINNIWQGDHKWAKVEQVYPFYIRDRTL